MKRKGEDFQFRVQCDKIKKRRRIYETFRECIDEICLWCDAGRPADLPARGIHSLCPGLAADGTAVCAHAGRRLCDAVQVSGFLEKRLDVKEKQAAQKGVLAFSGLMFIGGFVVAGLDFRFGCSCVPNAVVIAASVLFLLAYALYAEVMRENAYLSRTVKVEEGQTVVDTGLYGIVRHPMYSATILLFLMIPLILGSWYALIIFAFYPAIIIVRLKDEEALLTRELAGYGEYKKKVKYRLLPFIW